MPRIVTRPVIDSIASVTRPSWRNVVALRHWLRHAKTVIMSGMGGGSLCRILGWGIHSLHVAQPPCLISVLAKVLLYLSYLKANQYFTFQSGAYDLGIQANVAWNTAHGYLFYDSIQNINYLGDHFSPINLLLAFIYRLWESAVALLIVQSIGIGLAATALYLLTLKHFNHRWPAIAMTILFLCNSYLHQVSTFDFHPIAL